MKTKKHANLRSNHTVDTLEQAVTFIEETLRDSPTGYSIISWKTLQKMGEQSPFIL